MEHATPIVLAQLGPKSQTVLLARLLEGKCPAMTDLIEAQRVLTDLVESCRSGCPPGLLPHLQIALAEVDWRRGQRRAALRRMRTVRAEVVAKDSVDQQLLAEIDRWFRERAQKP
jgi:hypothetical protein